MVQEINGKVPLLGEQKVKATAQAIVTLVRHMDGDGTFEPERTQVVNGQVQAVAGRGNIMSGEDLIEAILDGMKPILRDVVRDELARQRLGD
jgi:hypothetical protein